MQPASRGNNLKNLSDDRVAVLYLHKLIYEVIEPQRPRHTICNMHGLKDKSMIKYRKGIKVPKLQFLMSRNLLYIEKEERQSGTEEVGWLQRCLESQRITFSVSIEATSTFC